MNGPAHPDPDSSSLRQAQSSELKARMGRSLPSLKAWRSVGRECFDPSVSAGAKSAKDNGANNHSEFAIMKTYWV